MENSKGVIFSVQFLDFCTQSLVESDSNIDRSDVQFGQYPSVINSNFCSKFQPTVKTNYAIFSQMSQSASAWQVKSSEQELPS